jgi:hypothetical protein
LLKVFQNEIEDQRIKWRTLSDSDWHDELVSIERKEQRDLLEENKAKKRTWRPRWSFDNQEDQGFNHQKGWPSWWW